MIDLARVTPIERMAGDDGGDTKRLGEALALARAYMRGFRWCRGIREEYFGTGVGGIVAAFLFRIEPAKDEDEWLWVIVGDLPSAYLVTDEAPDGDSALEGYCELMSDWVHAVRTGTLGKDVFPVDAAATEENAAALESRIEFLRTEIIGRS